MQIDYDSVVAPHRQIADWLRARIEAGELRPGRRMPSEEDIHQETGAARTTIRRAMKVLRDEGLVVTIGGRGSYVKI